MNTHQPTLASNPGYTQHLNLNLKGVRPLFLGPLPSLEGNKALVTGGATGMGQGIALQLARAGATVMLHWVSEEREVEQTLKIFEAESREKKMGSLIPFRADFRDAAQIDALFNETIKQLGTLHTLVNNAGITRNLALKDWTVEEMTTLFQVNVIATMRLTQLAVAHMAAHGIRGEIINVGSPHARDSMAGHAMYAASKAADERFSAGAMIEVVGHDDAGIRINTIVPGWVLVDNHFLAEGDADFAAGGRSLPEGRQTAPEEVGTFVAQLAAGWHPYFHGTPIVLDGGQLCRWRRGSPFPELPHSASFGERYMPKIR